MSPTQRSIKVMKNAGWEVAITEKWNPFARIRQDLWGFVDILAMRVGSGILGIQVTSAANHAKRVDKIRREPRARLWLECGGKIVVHSWGKKGKRGERKRWTLREEEYHGETPQNLLLPK